MKPLKSEFQDTKALAELGRASVQIVHDLKNQLNGLKLYATFLRRRMEKTGAAADEQETIAKLIAGLERAASDMSMLVSYGRPLELHRQPRADLSKILAGLAGSEGEMKGVRLELEDGSFAGEFDVAALSEAFQAITAGALQLRRAAGEGAPVTIRLRRATGESRPSAVIEWPGIKPDAESDPFYSFAGSGGLRLALAARIIEAHGGEAGQTPQALRVRLPVTDDGR